MLMLESANVKDGKCAHGNKIGYLTNGDAVYQVAERSAKLEAERQSQRPVVLRYSWEVVDDDERNEDGQYCEDRVISLQHAKR